MQGIKVILGTYNTMPEGASSSLFELTYQSSWRPFLSSLYKFSNIRAVLFYSGTVLQWIEVNHPEFILLLEEMISRKQIELLGGGFFSPLMSVLEPTDKVGQIEMLTTYLRKTFGKRPSGGWLYEYAWDESAPQVFSNAGLSYSFLPAKPLIEAGLLNPATLPVLITEDQRKLLYLFPVLDLEEEFEEPVPFEAALEELTARYAGAELYTLMVSGQSVPWMWNVSGIESPDVLFEKTFAWFQKNCLLIETMTAHDYAKLTQISTPPVYLSSCASQRFCRDGTKRGAIGNRSTVQPDRVENSQDVHNINIKQMILQNSFSRKLYDKMYYVDTMIALLRGDKARKKSAQEDLWRSQSGDSSWEGRLGGIRRPEVRMKAYQSLIEAEKTTRIHGVFVPGLILDDIDCDGKKEVLYHAADFNCYIHEKGASVFELDSFKTHQNLCSVYTVGQELGPFNSFVDRICQSGDFTKTSVDLSSSIFGLEKIDKSVQKVSFVRDIPSLKLSIRKSYLFQKHCVSVDYEIVNQGDNTLAFRLVTALNLQLGENLKGTKFSFALGRGSREYPDATHEYSGQTGLSALNSVHVEDEGTRNVLEMRSDSAFAFRMQHRFDPFSTADLQRLLDSPFVAVPVVLAASTTPKEGQSIGANADVSCGQDLGSNNLGPNTNNRETLGLGLNSSQAFYQGTEMLFGWDLEMPSDATRNVSLSLHFSN